MWDLILNPFVTVVDLVILDAEQRYCSGDCGIKP